MRDRRLDRGAPGERRRARRGGTRALWLATILLVGLTMAACGGDGDDETAADGDTTATETTETETAPTETETAPEDGTEVAGRDVFIDTGCASCHTLAAADATGTTGPDLDETLPGESREQIRTSIVDPDADVTEGFSAGVMPQDYQDQLSEAELSALVDFLATDAGR